MLRKGKWITGLLLGYSAVASAADLTLTAVSHETGTIRATGPNTACSGDQFVNVQGANNGTFASYAVLRVEVGRVQAAFDAAFGAGNWSVTGVSLQMVQTGATFEIDGLVDVYYSSDDVTNAKSSSSPLKWPFFDGGIPDLPSDFITQIFYSPAGAGTVDTINLSGSAVLKADIANTADGVVTIVLVDADPDVATSHRGQNPFRNRSVDPVVNGLSPKLVITASGPSQNPSTFVLRAWADETATVQPGGPRPPCNGDRFFNVEGVNNGTFASYGVLRFDVNDMKAAFNALYGAGNWSVTSVSVDLTQEVAAFSLDGFIDWYYSTDDTTDVKTSDGGLTYPFFDGGVPDLPVEFITQTFFSKSATGNVDTIDLSSSAPLKADIANDAGGIVTVVINEGDPDVAATYRGQDSFLTRRPPTLVVTVEGSGGVDCRGTEDASATCKLKGGKRLVIVKLKGSVPGDTFTVDLSTGGHAEGIINSKGKGKAKFNDQPAGGGTATVRWGCGAVDTASYTCP